MSNLRTLGISFVLGAALGGSFNSTISIAGSKIKRLGATVHQLETEPTVKLMDGFYRLRDKVRTSRKELQAAEADLADLKKQADDTGGAKGMLARRIASAEKRVKTLAGSVNRSTHQFLDHKAKLTNTGQSLDQLIPKYRRLTSAVEKAKKAQADYGAIEARQKSVLENRAAKRGQMFDAVALGSMVAAPVVSAIQMSDTRAKLGTVLNAEDKDAALAEANKTAAAMAKQGIASLAEGLDIQYALNSAGLTASASRTAAQVVAKVAKVTSGVPDRVGEVIATTYNNLGSSLEGTTEDRLNRIGDLLTKAQLKFQIRDFGQLGESMSQGAAGLASYNVVLSQGVTLLGQLNTAGLQGGSAGTALNAVLRSLGKAQKEYGIELVRNKDGQLDMLATLEQLRGAVADMDQDTRAQSLQQVFGDEGAKGVVPLLNNLDAVKAAYQDVNEGSKGIVNKEITRFTENAAGRWRKMTGIVSVLGDTLGTVLLPGLTAVLGGVVAILGPVADFAASHETLVTIVAGVAAGLIVLKVASIGLGYGWTFVQGGALMVRKALWLVGTTAGWTAVKTRALTVAQKAWAIGSTVVVGAAKAMRVAMHLLKVAVLGNPIGLVIGGLALATGLLISNWEPVKDFFLNLWTRIGEGVSWLWDKIKAFVSGVTTVLKTVVENSPIGMLFKAADWVGGLFGGGKEDKASPGKTVVSQSQQTAPVVNVAGNTIQPAPVNVRPIQPAIQPAPVVNVAGNTLPPESASARQRDVSERVSPTPTSFKAAGREAAQITIHQTINVNGSGMDKGQVRSAVATANDGLKDRVSEVLEDLMRERKRLAYG